VAAKQLPTPLGDALLLASREAFVRGLQLSAVIGAIGLAGMAIVAAILLRHVQTGSKPGRHEDSEPEDSGGDGTTARTRLEFAVTAPGEC
jgi:DHA2 family multidrug resistance protein-like MFS transporter